MARRALPGVLTGALFIVASAALGASALDGAPEVLDTVGFALLAAAVATIVGARSRAARTRVRGQRDQRDLAVVMASFDARDVGEGRSAASRFVDPVTGVGNRRAATVALDTLHPGDGILLLSVDEETRMRLLEGDAKADLALGQLGLHLRSATRAGDLVARYDDDVFFVLVRRLSSSTEPVVERIIDSWQRNGAAGHIRAGAALHFADSAPLDTLDRASSALDAARADRGCDVVGP